jgi:hypothetical protein
MEKYTIVISEEQRAILYAALRPHLQHVEASEEEVMLGGMLRDLPEHESLEPGAINDFTA